MFGKVNVPILGLIENMSHFVCPNDGNIYHIFGKGGGEREAKKMGVPLLGQIPLEMQVRESGDEGKPVALEDAATHPASHAFHEVARQLISIVAARQ
jgi:ATP-binding protein involved in chromosome partitioning